MEIEFHIKGKVIARVKNVPFRLNKGDRISFSIITDNCPLHMKEEVEKLIKGKKLYVKSVFVCESFNQSIKLKLVPYNEI